MRFELTCAFRWGAIALILSGLTLSAKVPPELKAKLFARYDQENLNVAHNKILVAPLNGQRGNVLSYCVNYDYFYPTFTDWPKKYQQRNRIDPQTTEEVESSARLTDALNMGEMLRVDKLYVLDTPKGNLVIDFYLIALDGKRIARLQNRYANGEQGVPFKVDFGFHFRFTIPPKSPAAPDGDYYQEVCRVISGYFIPTDEYLKQAAGAVQTEQTRKDVQLKPGMSEQDVVRALGEPQRRVEFGKKTLLRYADLTIEFEDGKLIEVKTN